MATYNGECWIEEQLKSIIEQKDVDISILYQMIYQLIIH